MLILVSARRQHSPRLVRQLAKVQPGPALASRLERGHRVSGVELSQLASPRSIPLPYLHEPSAAWEAVTVLRLGPQPETGAGHWPGTVKLREPPRRSGACRSSAPLWL